MGPLIGKTGNGFRRPMSKDRPKKVNWIDRSRNCLDVQSTILAMTIDEAIQNTGLYFAKLVALIY